MRSLAAQSQLDLSGGGGIAAGAVEAGDGGIAPGAVVADGGIAPGAVEASDGGIGPGVVVGDGATQRAPSHVEPAGHATSVTTSVRTQ